ncbi:MAG: GIY-YIG nuclease family protein [Brevinema sp.]
METWYLYLLRCDNGSLYTGIAKNPFRRFDQHLLGKGASYTRMHVPVSLLYIEEIQGHGNALKRERAVKKLSKKAKEAMCMEHYLAKASDMRRA